MADLLLVWVWIEFYFLFVFDLFVGLWLILGEFVAIGLLG